MQPESLEFFSSHDPLYRTYGKQQGLRRQKELFEADPSIESDWYAYQARFKALSHWVKSSEDPFDVSLGRGKQALLLREAWERNRASRRSLSDADHPYRHQGDGKTYTYKLFTETGYHLLAEGGRLGFILPSGIWTDKGSAELRALFLTRSRWEWCYGFENKQKIFPIHSMFKFAPIVVERGGQTGAVQTAFMRHDVAEWERPDPSSIDLHVKDVQRFSPTTLSFLELKDHRDLAVTDAIYADHPLLGEVVSGLGATYNQELNLTSASKHFVSLSKLADAGLIDLGRDDERDPRVRARLRVAGYLPLYEGKSVWIHDPYFLGGRSKASTGRFVRTAVLESELEHNHWMAPRLCFRDIASSTNQRSTAMALMPPAPHGNSLPTLDGLGRHAPPLLATMTSLVLDFIIRMKVSSHLNWFYVETLPIASGWDAAAFVDDVTPLVYRLNCLGEEFGGRQAAIVEGRQRMATRLLLDSLVAGLYELDVKDFEHIASRFPIYDRHAEAFAYPGLAVEVYQAFSAGGSDAAVIKANELTRARADAGYDFGLDEVYVPDGGWERANAEARKILEAG